MSYKKDISAASSAILNCVFCLCVSAVTCEEKVSVPLPEGLVLVEDFVSPEEEALLLAAIDWSSASHDVTGEGLHNVFCRFVLGS